MDQALKQVRALDRREHRLFDHQGMFLGTAVRGDFSLEALAHDTIVDVNLLRRAVDASWTCTVLLWHKI